MTTYRAPRENDLPVLTALRNDVAAQHAMLASPRENTVDDVRAWIDRRMSDPHALFFVVADEGDRAVGFFQVIAIDERSRHGTFGIGIEHAHRGRGHGRAATEQMLSAARADGRLDKILLFVATDNPAAALYRSLGFREVGVLRRHYRGPEHWHDVALMERFLVERP